MFDIDLLCVGGVKLFLLSILDWYMMLIGGLGKGGKGYYVLDIIDFMMIIIEIVFVGKVMWEFGGFVNV